MNRRSLLRLSLAAAAACASTGAWSASNSALTLLVGYSAGGSADLVARVVAPEVSKQLGRQVIVENIAGASGMMALTKMMNSPADGQFLYMGGTDTVLIPMVNPKVKHRWDADLVPLGRISTVPMIFAVPSNSKYTSLTDLMTAGRKAGEGLRFNFATPGVGTMQHLYGALINKQGGLTMTHVPYRGGAQIVNDLVGQQVDGAVLVMSTALPFLKEGKIKAISVSDADRVSSLPNVKRIGEEAGFNDVSLPLWQGLFVKQGTPAAIAASYEKALQAALAQPAVKTKLAEYGITLAPMNGASLGIFVKSQAQVYRDIVDAAKITLD
ncbi:Tripartite-type tricarboxylate transporter, receptor component TctC [Roseateles sp. YR242]|uniref:Bug family tripartite tricarboxylate transporter substrate binding protein n=1 Tax=Roseateles sp. YR242 TaxID=1855305 RepID=UPI0008C9E5D7|nr:tripartite tricarboxylate transporter substrate binding protein [Roseateles sp. YR242]SEK64940.1 Tripartite-type tricarboxylate transporter, receptor component TctC [Roseateles sp. YR242]